MRKMALYISVAVMVIAMFLPCAVDVGAVNPPAQTDKVATVKANLNILAVDSAEVGQTVKITVSSNMNKVVADAAVYIIDTDNITSPFDMKAVTSNNNNYADIAAKIGLPIGKTDSQGNIQYVFNENGWYIIVATKEGFNPGYRKIAIGKITQLKQLVLKMPDATNSGEAVQIGVFNRGDQSAVGGASIYALKLVPTVTVAPPIMLPSTSNRKPEFSPSVNARGGNSDSPEMVAQRQPGLEEIKSKGVLIGNTGDDGLLQYTFTEAGVFIIAAVKDGYTPGIGRLNVKKEDKVNLQIKAPGSAAVSENITIVIFEQRTNKLVENAAVYILKSNPVAVPVPTPTENGTAAQKILVKPLVNPDIEHVIKDGTLIGYTNAGGKISYSFSEAGRYFIVASKDGYDPDLARIEVGSPQIQNYLKLVVPAMARVNQEITVKVSSRSNRGEGGVNIYAIKNSDLPTDNTTGPAASLVRPQVYAEYAVSKGTLIGTTDENGKLAYAFTQQGRFILVAIKDGFVPGFGRINVALAMSNALAFKMPSHAVVDEEVSIKVVQKNDGTPVADADIYAYRINGFIDSIGHFFRETFSFGSSAREKYAGGISEIGEFIGATDNTGALLYAFPEKGNYVLVTFKSGYVPDFGKIDISEPAPNKSGK